jgi:hypothetical protein
MGREKETKFETKLEHIPTSEEIHKIFRKLIKGEYKEVREIGDEQGPYILEIAIPGEKEGETIQYEYMRKGEYKEGASLSTEIYIVYYENGIPVGRTSAARLVDGKWIIL